MLTPDVSRRDVTTPDLCRRLENPNGVLSRTDLRDLGYGRRAVDAIFRACPNIYVPSYSRPLIRVEDYRKFLESHTYREDRVFPGRC